MNSDDYSDNYSDNYSDDYSGDYNKRYKTTVATAGTESMDLNPSTQAVMVEDY